MKRRTGYNKERRKSKVYTPIILLAPAFLLVVGVIIYPICNAIGLSFQYYKLTDYANRHFVGLENYISVWKNELFFTALGNTIKWVLITVIFQFIFGLILALILNTPFRGRGIIRSVTLMPWVTPGVVIALMWIWIYNGNYGILNKCLTAIGLINKNVPWLGLSETALYSQIVTLIWQGIPFFAIMLLAALQTIPTDLYEAADISGANIWQKFIYITLPELEPTIITTSMLRCIWVFNNVEVLYLMTGGGPGYSSMTVSLLAYMKAQKSLDFGYGSTIAIYGTLFMIVFMFIYLKFTKKVGRSDHETR